MKSIRDIESLLVSREIRREDFEESAHRVVDYQRARIPFYDRYCERAADIGMTHPYLPVSAFKDRRLATESSIERVFESSGTGSSGRSRHFVHRLGVYDRSVISHFEGVFGRGPYTIVGHLPAYHDRGERSSLIHMARTLMDTFGNGNSGFSLDDPDLISRASTHAGRSGEALVLIGAAFGLLDLIDDGGCELPEDAIVIETGGMKTRRRETVRGQLHARLGNGFGLDRTHIWSEYGMCELLSQMYTRGGETFYPPPWLHVEVVSPDDPASVVREGEEGLLAVFDLANMYSVSAILTEDRALARTGGVEVLGRATGADLRGCNFLVTD